MEIEEIRKEVEKIRACLILDWPFIDGVVPSFSRHFDPHALFEFPVRRLRNINSVVKIIRPVRWSDDYHYGVDTRSDTFLGDLFVPFGKVNEFERDFLGRFNQKRKSPDYYWWIRFRTLLTGYQLFKRDPEQFRNALKTAKDEEEFCVLAGMS